MKASSGDKNDDVVVELTNDLQEKLEINNIKFDACNTPKKDHPNPPILICDAGYGLPREQRPKQEKILAIARQLINFIQWQQEQVTTRDEDCFASIRVVACPNEEMKDALQERTIILFNERRKSSSTFTKLPQHISFSCQSLEEVCQEIMARTHSMDSMNGEGEPNDLSSSIIYLSPDAKDVMDSTLPPPIYVIVGLVIDRRIQVNRSLDRATQLATTTSILPKRWPLDQAFQNISSNEPLNIDCILEGMQQWWWNSNELLFASSCDRVVDSNVQKETFVRAATQAIQHHVQRHPSRPIHKLS